MYGIYHYGSYVWFAHLTKYVYTSPPHIQSGSAPLRVASRNGHKDVVTTLLRNGADVNLRFKVRTVLECMYSSCMTGNNIFITMVQCTCIH